MGREAYIALLDRALVSPYGLRIDLNDPKLAHNLRCRLYRLRATLRREAQTEPATTPVVAYGVNGELHGVLNVLQRRKPTPVAADGLQFRVWEGALYILPVSPRPEPELQLPDVEEIDFEEMTSLPTWPPGQPYNR
jgi:hypothetical protein